MCCEHQLIRLHQVGSHPFQQTNTFLDSDRSLRANALTQHEISRVIVCDTRWESLTGLPSELSTEFVRKSTLNCRHDVHFHLLFCALDDTFECLATVILEIKASTKANALLTIKIVLVHAS